MSDLTPKWLRRRGHWLVPLLALNVMCSTGAVGGSLKAADTVDRGGEANPSKSIARGWEQVKSIPLDKPSEILRGAESWEIRDQADILAATALLRKIERATLEGAAARVALVAHKQVVAHVERLDDKRLAGDLLRTLEAALDEIPQDYGGQWVAESGKEARYEALRFARLSAFGEAAVGTAGEAARPLLWRMFAKKGVLSGQAVDLLGQIGDPADLDKLIGKLQTTDDRFTLHSFPPELVMPRLLKAFSQATVERTRGRLLSNIPKPRSDEDVLYYFKLAQTEDKFLKRVLLEEIADVKRAISIEHFISLLSSSDARIRYEAARGIALLMGSSERALEKGMDLLRNDQNEIIRRRIVHELMEQRIYKARSVLEEVARQDKSARVRGLADYALNQYWKGEN